jgi:hypothetical protein
MELCNETLGDYLEKRNKKVCDLIRRSHNKDKFDIEFFSNKKQDMENLLTIYEKILSQDCFVYLKFFHSFV